MAANPAEQAPRFSAGENVKKGVDVAMRNIKTAREELVCSISSVVRLCAQMLKEATYMNDVGQDCPNILYMRSRMQQIIEMLGHLRNALGVAEELSCHEEGSAKVSRRESPSRFKEGEEKDAGTEIYD